MAPGRVLIFVQHLRGIGHLQRSAVLARAMAGDGLSVEMISGGMPVPGIDLAGIPLHQLPPVRSPDDSYTRLVDADGRAPDADFHRRRIETLLDTFKAVQPDIVMVEMFPFGRSQIAQEFIALIEAARAARPRPWIVSSVRDIIATKRSAARYEEMADQVMRWFDAVLVHGDPNLLPLEESFPPAGRLADLLHYTGYVLSPAPAREAPAGPDREGEVLVSAGGGAFGAALMWAALEAHVDPALDPALAQAPWRLLTGPNIADDEAKRLLARAGPGVTIERMRPDFRRLLAQARASVSQCGYNTSMEVMAAGTPAVLVPFGQGRQTEQNRRAAALAGLDRVEMVAEAKLDGATLAAALNRAAARSPAAHAADSAIDMSGAATTARLMRRWLSGRRRERAGKATSSA
jgi:predicted glycosyltransferase